MHGGEIGNEMRTLRKEHDYFTALLIRPRSNKDTGVHSWGKSAEGFTPISKERIAKKSKKDIRCISRN